jgi:hypothetical protein
MTWWEWEAGAPRLTSFSAGILVDGFGLEVVVSLAATIDEVETPE